MEISNKGEEHTRETGSRLQALTYDGRASNGTIRTGISCQVRYILIPVSDKTICRYVLL